MDMMLDIREASVFLGVGEEKLNGLVAGKIVPAYMIAGKFLRFKKSELEILKAMMEKNAGHYDDERVFNKAFSKLDGLERVKELLRANDIYICIGIAIFLIFLFMFFRK